MDKNSLIGWTLMGILFVAMFYFMEQQRPEPKEPETTTEEIIESDSATDEVIPERDVTLDPAIVNGDSAVADNSTVADSVKQLLRELRFGAFAPHMDGEAEVINVTNDVLSIDFSSQGAIPQSVELLEYKTWDQEPLIIFGTEHGTMDVEFSVYTADGQTEGFHTTDLFFTPTVEKLSHGETAVRFRVSAGPDSYYEHEYIVPAEGYSVEFKVNTRNFDDVIYSRRDFFELNWAQQFQSIEHNIQTERMYSSLSFADSELDVDKVGGGMRGGSQGTKTKDAAYSVKWVSFKQKFFSSILIADETFAPGSKFESTVPGEKTYVKDASAALTFDYESGEYFSFPMEFYFGPNRYKGLKALDIKAQKTMQLGVSVIRWVNLGIIIPMFNFLNKYVSNYGLIILLLTVFIKLIVTPFTYRSYLSMAKMKVLQPELTELRERLKGDQQKIGVAQMELYKKAGVNPLGGCLPMLFQFPILIAMYRFFPASIELRQESFLWATDLSTYDSIYSWSQQIPLISNFYGNHISLFTILMAITSFFYTRMNSTNTQVDPNNPMAQQMKMFQYIMPFMLLFIFNKFSAALSYYYFLFNLFSVAQQWAMKKWLIDEDKIHAQIQANKTKVRKKSKWQKRMEDMMKQQEAMKKQKGNKNKKKKR